METKLFRPLALCLGILLGISGIYVLMAPQLRLPSPISIGSSSLPQISQVPVPNQKQLISAQPASTPVPGHLHDAELPTAPWEPAGTPYTTVPPPGINWALIFFTGVTILIVPGAVLFIRRLLR